MSSCYISNFASTCRIFFIFRENVLFICSSYLAPNVKCMSFIQVRYSLYGSGATFHIEHVFISVTFISEVSKRSNSLPQYVMR